MATFTFEEAVQNPIEYLAKGHHKDPTKKDTTRFVIAAVIKVHPALYFHYHLDEEPQFERETLEAAKSLIERDPLAALLAYEFHRKPKFVFLSIPLLHELLKDIKETEDVDYKVASEISYLVGVIRQNYPDFAQRELKNLPRTEVGESEYKSELTEK
jgi:hypothetical protein